MCNDTHCHEQSVALESCQMIRGNVSIRIFLSFFFFLLLSFFFFLLLSFFLSSSGNISRSLDNRFHCLHQVNVVIKALLLRPGKNNILEAAIIVADVSTPSNRAGKLIAQIRSSKIICQIVSIFHRKSRPFKNQVTRCDHELNGWSRYVVAIAMIYVDDISS